MGRFGEGEPPTFTMESKQSWSGGLRYWRHWGFGVEFGFVLARWWSSCGMRRRGGDLFSGLRGSEGTYRERPICMAATGVWASCRLRFSPFLIARLWMEGRRPWLLRVSGAVRVGGSPRPSPVFLFLFFIHFRLLEMDWGGKCSGNVPKSKPLPYATHARNGQCGAWLETECGWS